MSMSLDLGPDRIQSIPLLMLMSPIHSFHGSWRKGRRSSVDDFGQEKGMDSEEDAM